MSRVLLIDNDDRLRSTLAKTLQRAGFDVSEACTGDEGLGHCRQRPPDAVVTDIVMPDKEGLETLAELRKEFPDLPIVAVSGVAGSQDYGEVAQRLGASQTLSKPFLPGDLLEALRLVLAKSRS